MLIVVRSIAFNVLFYLNTALWLIIALPTFFMPYRAIIAMAKTWGRSNLVLLRVVAGIDYEIRGREKIPQGPLIVAAKHQSAWETFALLPLFDNPLFIVKRELQWIPIFGWLMIKGRMVPVDRSAGSQALPAMTARARIELGRRPPADHLSRGHAAAGRRRAALQVRRGASLRRGRACRAFRSRSIPACSGRAARSSDCRGRCWWRCSIRSRPGSTRMYFSSGCSTSSKRRRRALIERGAQTR